ncbi:MAG: hypothetical protein KDM63_00620 [Verrucomicrobiae bacterium]|nr:hypothetical protein [Verrucomicrobiae bacterium]MCB1090718.1 hypothetical protein [Verrucomicrobiae bacterium]
MKPSTRLLSVIVVLAVGYVVASAQDEPLVDKGLLDFLKIVEDADGFTNLRAGASLDAKIVGKVLSGGPVFADPQTKNGFHIVNLDREDGVSERHIHGSRLRPVSSWKAFGPEASSGRLRHLGFEAVVTEPPFVASEHKVKRNAEGVVLVDGKIPWGQDGGQPNRMLKLEVAIDGKKIDLPAAATDNLYEPNFDTLVLLTPGDPARHSILMMANSDGAGGYIVVWAFEKGSYRGRAVIMP